MQTQEEKLQKKLIRYKTEISSCLGKEPTLNKKIIIQDENSIVEIPDIDISFGTNHNDKQIAIARWIFNLKIKEREPIIDFLLSKESFRLFLDQDFDIEHQYYDFVEIFLNIITIQWLVEIDKIAGSSDARKMDISKRLGFKDKEYFTLGELTHIIFHCYRNNVSASHIFNYFTYLLNEGIEKNSSKLELFKKMRNWFSIQFKYTEQALPILVTKRHFEIINELHNIGSKASAKKIGEKLNLSYNVINIDFKRLYDKYIIYWKENIKQYKLGIYQHFIRITLSNVEYLEPIKKLLKSYQDNISYVNIGRNKDGYIILANIECSFLIHQKLNWHLEKLVNEGKIESFFFSMVRRRRNTSSFIIDHKLEYTEETYKQLLTNPTKYPCCKLVLLDERFDVSNSKTNRKTTIDENILLYFTILSGRHLGKAHYLFRPLQYILELCEKNNINTEDNSAFMYFVNQLDIRCHRLGLLEYYLNINNNFYNSGIYVELLNELNKRKLEKLIEKLEIFAGLWNFEFLDRTILFFPKNSSDRIFHEILIEFLNENDIKYLISNSVVDHNIATREIVYHKIIT